LLQIGGTNIERLTRLSSEQELVIQLRATLIDRHKRPHQRLNITHVQELPNKDHSISKTQEFATSSTHSTK
jgi:hypothetical protein